MTGTKRDLSPQILTECVKPHLIKAEVATSSLAAITSTSPPSDASTFSADVLARLIAMGEETMTSQIQQSRAKTREAEALLRQAELSGEYVAQLKARQGETNSSYYGSSQHLDDQSS